MRTADFEYPLPDRLIAQQARPRGASRLLVLDRASGDVALTRISALPGLLAPGDLMLLNEVRVIPARLRAHRPRGGETELLLVRPLGGSAWEVMARPAKRLRPGGALSLASGFAVPRERLAEGTWRVEFDPPLDESVLAVVGEVPLPPYIRREHGPSEADRLRYQTVYARAGRAVAAPTAGLHFTPELLAAVGERGVEVARLILHVGPGTFRPVQADDPLEHKLEPEDYEILPEAAFALNRVLGSGRRVVCVGTTACRALEHALQVGCGRVLPGVRRADLFILPGYRFRGTGALLTNFHLPRSTLLMLVAALAGRKQVLSGYELAVREGFSFYSFGDAMLVL
ncbi:MAG TPA: tRNA preQ1(34) S-adenosylmethionine ribosyltransferase-isomerase QueA [Thermoanaerobaculaceae bacterium]|nr:tRNA preQ1(34) S-adenosylmethionine ribosyltransferase-isomerase QueA [Thermoanaerobaculaceae bacterium]